MPLLQSLPLLPESVAETGGTWTRALQRTLASSSSSSAAGTCVWLHRQGSAGGAGGVATRQVGGAACPLASRTRHPSPCPSLPRILAAQSRLQRSPTCQATLWSASWQTTSVTPAGTAAASSRSRCRGQRRCTAAGGCAAVKGCASRAWIACHLSSLDAAVTRDPCVCCSHLLHQCTPLVM